MTSDPTQPDGGADDPLDRTPREAIDETETTDSRATPLPAHVAIEGYDIIRELHRGGQGIVYEAVQKSTKRKVAIKILLEGRFASSSARRRFQREITLAAGLKHPNIIAIFDSGETPDGHQFCVMDYVRGRSIRDYVRQNKLPLEDTLELFSLVCAAAHFANQKGVIHRDLKPSNILVDTDGVPRVLDFGLAKQLAGGTQSLVSITGQVMGTLQYMSPEQTRGNPDEIDARSDVYSLGVVLYELLTGTHPYPVGGEMYEVVKHITETEPELPSKVWTADSGVSRRKSGRFRVGQCPIDDELRTILLKSLSKGRERRYQSADALRQDIISYLAGEPIEAKRDSSLYVLKKSLRRHRTPIAVTVAAVAFALLTLFVGLRLGEQPGPALVPTGPITSLAVLPLENLSGDPDQEYFSDGMTSELITALGKIKALTVISRMSVMEYKDTDKSPSEIARELNVDALVEGTVTRFGDRVRIAANLIRAATSEQLWGDSYERDMRDILSMQGEIARSIAREIEIAVTPAEELRLTHARRVNPEAYRLYLKGRHHQQWWTKAGYEKAIEHFERALTLDPTYAPAYWELGRCYEDLAFFGHLPPKTAYPRAEALRAKGLELDDTLAEDHVSLATKAFYYGWNWVEAEREYLQAIKADHGDAKPHLMYAWYLMGMHRFDEALLEARRAQELDPLSLLVSLAVGDAFHFARRYDDAIQQWRKTVELVPNDPRPYSYLAFVYEQTGMHDEAVVALVKAVALSGDERVFVSSRGYAVAGNTAVARKILGELLEESTHAYVPSHKIALLYASLGQEDQAFHWLEKAYEERDGQLPFLGVNPTLDALHDDPRFEDLLRRIGLEPESKSRAAVEPPADKPADGKIMLAVLAFENLGSPDDEYFADGISDEIRSRLAAVRKLGVISRSSAFQYKNTDKTNRQIGSELGVDYLIDGTIRWDKRGGGAGRVRITPELIRISDDMSLWSQSYNRVIEDIFEVQSDIAGQVIQQLKITLLEPERKAIKVRPTENLDAYQAYLRGVEHAEGPAWESENECQLAVQMFERAVKLDPGFTLAHARLSMAHSSIHHYGYDRIEARAAKSKAAADRALELQPDLAEAHMALGWYHYYCHRDYKPALEEFSIAVKDLSNDALLWDGIASVHRRSGRFEEGLGGFRKAFELRPRDGYLAKEVAITYLLLRRYPEALRLATRSLSLSPDQYEAQFHKAEIHWLWNGDLGSARTSLEAIPKSLTSMEVQWYWIRQELLERDYQAVLDRLTLTVSDSFVLQKSFITKAQLAGFVYELMGKPERARTSYDAARIVLEREVQERPSDDRVRSSLGIVYAGMGRIEEAIREGRLGVKLLPISKDALIGPHRVEDLAFIYTLVREYDAAMDEIEYLLSIPCAFSVPLLRLDPRWDPLRDHPRYKAIMRRHGFEPESKSQATEPRDAKPPDDPMDSGGGN